MWYPVGNRSVMAIPLSRVIAAVGRAAGMGSTHAGEACRYAR